MFFLLVNDIIFDVVDLQISSFENLKRFLFVPYGTHINENKKGKKRWKMCYMLLCINTLHGLTFQDSENKEQNERERRCEILFNNHRT